MTKSSNSKKPKGKGFNILLLVAILVSISFFVFGVISRVIKVRTVIEGKDAVTKEQNDSSVSENSLLSEEKPRLPDIFPIDFPIYKSATLVSFWVEEGEKARGISIVWETSDSLDELSLFFDEELKSSGWKIVSSFSEEESLVITFKKNGIDGFIGVTEENGTTVISVTMGIS